MSNEAPQLPDILAGPILRRTEPGLVCVWLATRDPVHITGIVSAADSWLRSSAAPRVFGAGESYSLSFGRRLHISLVQMKPCGGPRGPNIFPDRVLLSYDLLVSRISAEEAQKKERAGGLRFDLTDASLLEALERTRKSTLGQSNKRLQDLVGFTELTDGRTLAFPPYPLPTFFIARDGNVNLLHGSCRKMHGVGVDGLALVHSLLANNVNDLQERPSSLLLTGDQIYADDVADCIIGPLVELGHNLLGFEETIRVQHRALPSSVSYPVRQLLWGTRGMIVRDCFTPDRAQGEDTTSTRAANVARNHLFGFGDFAAMYLLMWNAAVWPDRLKELDGAPSPPLIPLGPRRNVYFDRKEQLANTKQLAATLPMVRRVLANIPTYMLLDDHEITDDWNLNGYWAERALKHPTGRRIIANGLASYWAFQGWGNDPAAFPEEFYAPLVQYFHSEQANDTAYEDMLLSDRASKLYRWSFVAPTHPPVVFLDTRTRRGYDPVDKLAPPALLNDAAIDDFVALVRQHELNDLLIVVSPAPVIGHPGIEELQELQPIIVDEQPTAAEVEKYMQAASEKDLESWHVNRGSFYHFLFSIRDKLRPRACLFLSGDLHYSYAGQLTLRSATGYTSFVQFTSSAFKNNPHGEYLLDLPIRPLNKGVQAEKGFKKFEPYNESIWLNPPIGRPLPASHTGALNALVPGEERVAKAIAKQLRASARNRVPFALNRLERSRFIIEQKADAEAYLLLLRATGQDLPFGITDSSLGQLRMERASSQDKATFNFITADRTPEKPVLAGKIIVNLTRVPPQE